MSLSNNSTPSQSIDIVDPEGSSKKANSKAVNRPKPICFVCANSGYIKAGQFMGLPCPAGCLEKKRRPSE